MESYSLPVALAVVIKGNDILLIRRKKPEYAGFLALPGGKIELHEHVSDAAMREVFEEAGIETQFHEHLACVSEHVISGGKVLYHFVLHICLLHPRNQDISFSEEGVVEWVSLHQLARLQQEMVPTDFFIIERIVKDSKKGYFNCKIEKKNHNYTLMNFDEA